MRTLVGIGLLVARLAGAAAGEPVRCEVRLDAVMSHDDGAFLWYHPRPAAIPGGPDEPPTVVLTLQKHLVADDHYSGLYTMTSRDLGRTWSQPFAPTELDWRRDDSGATVAVCDVTPGWHAQTRRLLAIGAKVRYTPDGRQLLDRPKSNQPAYASYDPRSDRWSEWRWLELPDEPRYDLAVAGCSQWLVEPDGEILLPLYYKGLDEQAYSTAVFRCRFDGASMSVVAAGDELALAEVRGLCEPSLARCGGRYYLTLRNDLRGYVAASDDGLRYGAVRPWTFDDGEDLGSYNTQQHWLVHGDRLFLVYTRRGAENDHVFRHRAPLFLAEVERGTLQVLRSSERVLIPERGGELGNFGAASIAPGESWATVGEGVWSDDARRRGAKGTVWIARIVWK